MSVAPILAAALTARVAMVFLVQRPRRPRRQPPLVFRRQHIVSVPKSRVPAWAADCGDGGHCGDTPTPSPAYPLPNEQRDDGCGEPAIAATTGDHAPTLAQCADRVTSASAIMPRSATDELPHT